MMTDDFLNYLRYERNRSELTIRNYGRSLSDFESYFKNRDSQLSWESVDSDLIRDWMESMMDKGDMASTVNNCLSAVRSFFRFALSRGLVESDPSYSVKGPKKQKPLPQFVREDEMNRLIDMPQMWEEGYQGVLARTIIILFYETGIRLAELVGLDSQDVDLDSRQLKVTGKRDKQRVVPFGEELSTVLRDYILQRAKQLMSGNSLSVIWIFQSVVICHIRRIACYYIHCALSKNLGCLLNITFNYIYFIT